MKIILLDYRGTLDVLTDPVKFVNDLKAKGWITALWSGSSYEDVRREFPGLLEALNQRISKGPLGRDILEDFSYNQIVPSEVVILDDDPGLGKGMAESFNRCKAGLARYIPAEDWQSLL